MRRRIAVLVAATTSAIVVALVIPMCLLVQNLARDRALGAARQEAQNVATVVAGADNASALRDTIGLFLQQGARVSVVGPDGTRLGLDPEPAALRAAQEARRTRAAFTAPLSDGLLAVVPVTLDGGTTVVLRPVSDDELAAGVKQAWAVIALLGAVLVLGSVFAAHQLGRRVSEPVTDLAAVAHRLREGDLDARVTPHGPPETHELGEALNQLAGRIGELIDEEREAVADLGHRLRTPVTALRLDAEQVADPGLSARLREHVDHLHRTVDAVVRDARRATRVALPSAGDAAAVARARAGFWEPLAEDQARLLTAACDAAPLPVRVADADLTEALDTLLDNVFAHTPEGAPVRLVARRAGRDVLVGVEDGGPGMPVSPGRGHSGRGSTGLGLDIARQIARSGGGTLELGPSELGGLSALLRLPLVTPS